MRHGEPQQDEFPFDVWRGPDPELALVHADMGEWMDAHPCHCTEDDGVCLCNEEPV